MSKNSDKFFNSWFELCESDHDCISVMDAALKFHLYPPIEDPWEAMFLISEKTFSKSSSH